MKHSITILLAAVSILAASSCTKELENTVNCNAALNADMVYTANIADASKTTLGADGLSVAFTSGESISVLRYYSSDAAANNKFTMTAEGVKADGTASFAGSIAASGAQAADTDYAVLPYNASARIAASGKVLVSIPETCVGVKDGFPTVDGISANPMVAKAEGGSFAFRNVAALVKCNVVYKDIKSIVLTGNDSEQIAGTFYATFDGSAPAITEAVDGKTSITLVAADGGAIAPGIYYFVVSPQTFANGVTFTMTTTLGQTRVKTTKSSIAFKKAQIANVGDMLENTTVFPVVWPLGDNANTDATQPDWSKNGRWYSSQPQRAKMEFVSDAVFNPSTSTKLVPVNYNTDKYNASSPSFEVVSKKIYIFPGDAFYFTVALDNFTGKLKFTLPLVNTKGPKFWLLSYSLDGENFTEIDAKDLVVADNSKVQYSVHCSWDCPIWDNNASYPNDWTCNNVLDKVIPYAFDTFNGTLTIKFEPVIARKVADDNKTLLRNAYNGALAAVGAGRANSNCTRFYFADANAFEEMGQHFKTTPVSISIVK